MRHLSPDEERATAIWTLRRRLFLPLYSLRWRFDPFSSGGNSGSTSIRSMRNGGTPIW
ncbi:MAG: hypothetical protein ACUVSY_18820 [Roseiflexus sp.]